MGRPRQWQRREPLPPPREPSGPPPSLLSVSELMAQYRGLRSQTTAARQRGDRRGVLGLCDEASAVIEQVRRLGSHMDCQELQDELQHDLAWAQPKVGRKQQTRQEEVPYPAGPAMNVRARLKLDGFGWATVSVIEAAHGAFTWSVAVVKLP